MKRYWEGITELGRLQVDGAELCFSPYHLNRFIELGGDVNMIIDLEYYGKSSLLHIAVRHRQDIAVILLTKAGADWDILDQKSKKPLDYEKDLELKKHFESIKKKYQKEDAKLPDSILKLIIKTNQIFEK